MSDSYSISRWLPSRDCMESTVETAQFWLAQGCKYGLAGGAGFGVVVSQLALRYAVRHLPESWQTQVKEIANVLLVMHVSCAVGGLVINGLAITVPHIATLPKDQFMRLAQAINSALFVGWYIVRSWLSPSDTDRIKVLLHNRA